MSCCAWRDEQVHDYTVVPESSRCVDPIRQHFVAEWLCVHPLRVSLFPRIAEILSRLPPHEAAAERLTFATAERLSFATALPRPTQDGIETRVTCAQASVPTSLGQTRLVKETPFHATEKKTSQVLRATFTSTRVNQFASKATIAP